MFGHIKPGDQVMRYLSSAEIPMRLTVTHVDDRFIYCAGLDGWKFDRKTGAEVDEELGWGALNPETGVIETGSIIKDAVNAH